MFVARQRVLYDAARLILGKCRMPDAAPASFDDAYSTWKGWRAEDFGVLTVEQREYFDLEMRRLGDGAIQRVLEIGFGNGQFLSYARDRGWQAAGTEAIPELVERARTAGFEAYPAEALEQLPEAEFDLVAAFDVLEHIPHQQIPPFLRAAARCLAPGGAILCRFPNGDSPFGRPFQNGDVTHCTIIGESKLIFFARQTGLKVTQLGGEARPATGHGWRQWVARLVVRGLELTLEPCIKLALFPGWRFSMFSPNTVATLRRDPARPRATR
jgi:SAM-dependent methyltransferase